MKDKFKLLQGVLLVLILIRFIDIVIYFYNVSQSGAPQMFYILASLALLAYIFSFTGVLLKKVWGVYLIIIIASIDIILGIVLFGESPLISAAYNLILIILGVKVISLIKKPEFSDIWKIELGKEEKIIAYIPLILLISFSILSRKSAITGGAVGAVGGLIAAALLYYFKKKEANKRKRNQ